MQPPENDLSRRDFVGLATGAGLTACVAEAATPHTTPIDVASSLTINGHVHDLHLEPRITLLDLLRERLHLTGPKKGCDHGQCGACTVLVDGVRVLSCLTLAVTQDHRHIVTIEGLASGEVLHPMQAAFIEHDGFQCGFCTPGQICSAVAMLNEARSGMPSVAAAAEHRPAGQTLANAPGAESVMDAAEIRERMSGNICRCGAYPNIVAAIQTVARQGTADRSVGRNEDRRR
jgi:xanthine dehydrogenase YagT iron-sulfur-binding subunit